MTPPRSTLAFFGLRGLWGEDSGFGALNGDPTLTRVFYGEREPTLALRGLVGEPVAFRVLEGEPDNIVLLGEPLGMRTLLGEPMLALRGLDGESPALRDVLAGESLSSLNTICPETLFLIILFGEVEGLRGLVAEASLTATLGGEPTGL